jgi:hypothetical protein
MSLSALAKPVERDRRAQPVCPGRGDMPQLSRDPWLPDRKIEL